MAFMRYEYLLPYPPTINHYYGQRGTRKFIKASGKQYRLAVKDAVAGSYGGAPKLEGPVAVTVEAVLPDRRRRDLDNIMKCLLDALQHAGVYDDDTQVHRLLAEKAGVERGGRVAVSVEALTDGEEAL